MIPHLDAPALTAIEVNGKHFVSGLTWVALTKPHGLMDEARRIGVRFHPTRGSMSLGRSQGGLPRWEDFYTQFEDIYVKLNGVNHLLLRFRTT